MSNVFLAHAGHGVTEGHSLVHYLSEPIHVTMILVGVAALSILARHILRTLQLKNMRLQRIRKHR